MQRLTLAGRLLITALIVGGVYFGLKFAGIDLLKKFSKDNTETVSGASSESPTLPSGDATVSEASSSSSSESSSQTTASDSRGTFDYTPPVPVDGKLKGVVELGASGFNSFVVRIDKQKNWKLEKAEFGNSLVLENMATDDDVRAGLKKYIGTMLDFGVGGRDIHFVVSSGAVKAEGTQKIVRVLKSLNYFVNTVTPEQEGTLALKCVLPKSYEGSAYVVDIGSGNTKVSWINGGKVTALETYGSKYFQNGTSDVTVADEVAAKSKQIPSANRKTCFIIGGVPFEMAKATRNGKERFTVLKAPGDYKMENAKSKAGVNIYKGIADATGTQQFVFDWDANFTIGFLLGLPN